VFPVELDSVSKKLGPKCRLLRVKPFNTSLSMFFEIPEEDKWGEFSFSSNDTCLHDNSYIGIRIWHVCGIRNDLFLDK
jgi:hypothetical protein